MLDTYLSMVYYNHLHLTYLYGEHLFGYSLPYAMDEIKHLFIYDKIPL